MRKSVLNSPTCITTMHNVYSEYKYIYIYILVSIYIYVCVLIYLYRLISFLYNPIVLRFHVNLPGVLCIFVCTPHLGILHCVTQVHLQCPGGRSAAPSISTEKPRRTHTSGITWPISLAVSRHLVQRMFRPSLAPPLTEPRDEMTQKWPNLSKLIVPARYSWKLTKTCT